MIGVFCAGLSVLWPTLAEETHDHDHTGHGIEEVVVVGSLIRREEVYEGRAPVQTLDAGAFEAVGASQPVDILASLTSNSGSIVATQQNYLQGVSQFSLRGVGLSSTLTLLNGRRAGFAPVSNDVGQSFFDINTLPVLMIERVEILRDGASATYGSQAVAGVANIVTRKGFTGFELSGGYREASNRAYDVGFAAGLESQLGHLNLYGSWYEQDENFRTEFDWMIPRAIDPDGDGNIVEGSFDSPRGSPGSFRRAVANPDGTYSPYQVDGIDAPRFPDADCRAGGGFPSGSFCRMDFSDQRTMIAAEQRTQLFADGDLHLGSVLLLAEIGYSRNKVIDRVGNMWLLRGNVEGTNEIFVPANHPFNFWTDHDGDGLLTYVSPSEWIPGVHQAVSLGYLGRPLGAEATGENSGYENREFDVLRAMVGFETTLPNGWMGEGHIAHARSDLSVTSERYWISSEFNRVVSEGRWNPFGSRIVAPELVTPKTVADDGLAPSLYGTNAANSPEILAEFEGLADESARSVQRVVEFVASGDLFGWGHRPVSLAVGTHYRDLSYHFEPDLRSQDGTGPQLIRVFPSTADQQAWAVFTESLVYVGDRIELQLAARHESYDQAGSTTDPKIAAQFVASDWLSLRTSWGTSFQAPSVFQASGNTSSRTITDPFRFDSLGVARCTVDDSGAIVNRGDNFNVSTVLTGVGLSPQTATSANLGVLIQPRANSALSFDYWTLDYRDVIAQGSSFQAIVDDDCRDDGIPNDPRVKRDTSGQVNLVNTQYENVGAVRARGLDVNSYYNVPSSFGNFRITADATVLSAFDVNAGGQGYVDRLGNRNDRNGFAPTPEIRLNLGLNWQRKRHTAGLTVRYVDSYKNDEVESMPEISSWTTMDASYSYAFEDVFDGETTLFVGARNLTDQDPPPLPNGREGVLRYNLRPGFDGFVHDIKGRTLYVRVRWRSGS